ncbi:MAG TPA: hypothetical protein VFW66_08465 [Gemmatimonadales bacterium]|nr:hypothetical protein [Gemmatimonadales bacterium]
MSRAVRIGRGRSRAWCTQAALAQAALVGAMVAAAGAVVACGARGRGGPGGTVRLNWHAAGSDSASDSASGAMLVPGMATWCEGTRIAVVTAAQGDTGLGIVLHPRDSLAAGTYTISTPEPPSRTDAAGAALAFRLTTAATVNGYRSTAGRLTLTRVRAGRVWGTFTAQARQQAGTGTLTLAGELTGVPMRTGGPACAS